MVPYQAIVKLRRPAMVGRVFGIVFSPDLFVVSFVAAVRCMPLYNPGRRDRRNSRIFRISIFYLKLLLVRAKNTFK